LTPILNRDEASRSCHSGTSYPSVDLVLGMLCYRTDTTFRGLYQLTSLSPVTWTPIVDQTSGDARYVKIGGASQVAGNISLEAQTTERQVIFNVSATANRANYFFGRPSDESVGLYGQRQGLAVWTYFPVTNTFDFGASVVLTRGGQAIWHAGNDGAGSGLDADLLDGQNGSFYLNWANITNRPAFTDAATTTVAAIRAGVDIASRVAKTGDTMTGNLRGTSFRAAKGPPNAGDVSSNGFAFAGDGDTGLFTVDGGENSGTTQLAFYINNTVQVALSSGGQLWAANYGWLHDKFAFAGLRNISGYTFGRFSGNTGGNCGNIALNCVSYLALNNNNTWDMYFTQSNCTNCDCNCPSDCN
jgi:hypothetical protein